MKKRQLNYTANSYVKLNKNMQHKLAQNHALRIYNSNSIYSFIPKNGCSTMRLSLALANGCISDPKDFEWIHNNSLTFSADLPSLLLADYTFVILRCPFARLASVYLDKIVSTTWIRRSLQNMLKGKLESDEMTFRVFVKSLIHNETLRHNIHWRPQTDFLVYKEYDDYFNLENFSFAKDTIESKTHINIVDARNLTRHGIDSFILNSDSSYADYLVEDLQKLKRNGQAPQPSALYDDELITLVQNIYKEDISLYKCFFGNENLMFS